MKPNRHIFASLVTAAVLSSSLGPTQAAAGENVEWASASAKTAQALFAILISNKACTDLTDCRRKELLFIRPVDGGIEVTLYSMKDRNAIKAIAEECIKTLMDYEMESVEVRVSQGTRSESSGFFRLVDKSTVKYSFRMKHG